MKKLIITFFATVSLLSIGVFAFAASPSPAPVSAKHAVKTEKTKSDSTLLSLYAKSNLNSTVVSKVEVSQDLVPIFRKEGWIKVGNPRNGKVGWINKEQYHKAVNANFHRRAQTVFIEVDQNKTNPIITAYRNGKKLTAEQAKVLYSKIQKRQARFNKQMRRFQRSMRVWYSREMRNMNAFFMPLERSPMMQPVIIIERNQGVSNKNLRSKEKSTVPSKRGLDRITKKTPAKGVEEESQRS